MAAKKREKLRPRMTLAVDPGEQGGLALYVGEALVQTRATNGSSWRVMSADITEMCASYSFIPTEHRLCVIENGFGRGIGSKTLDRRRGIAQAAAESCGFVNYHLVYPATWQTSVWGGLKGRDTKELSLSHARERNPYVPIADHNVADAVLIGAWAVDNLLI